MHGDVINLHSNRKYQSVATSQQSSRQASAAMFPAAAGIIDRMSGKAVLNYDKSQIHATPAKQPLQSRVSSFPNSISVAFQIQRGAISDYKNLNNNNNNRKHEKHAESYKNKVNAKC